MNTGPIAILELPRVSDVLAAASIPAPPTKAMYLPGYKAEPPEWQKGPLLAMTVGTIAGILLGSWLGRRRRRR